MQVKVKGKQVYSSLQVKPAITATGNHIPYGITQCYLPPGRGDIPAFTQAEAGTRFSDPAGMQGWVDLGGWLESNPVTHHELTGPDVD